METKFESELGKRIVEGSRRKPTKKVAVVAFAIMSAAAFFGTAAFSFVTSAQYAPYMTQDDVYDHVQSTMDNSGGSVAVSRIMTLMTRSFDVDTGGGQHVDLVKFIYTMNVSIVDTDSTITAGDPIGDLNLVFTTVVPMPSFGLVMTVDAATYAADGTATAVDGDGTVSMTWTETALTDTTVAVTGIAVDANAPATVIGTNCGFSLYIELWIYYIPDIDGVATETPFGDPLIALAPEAF